MISDAVIFNLLKLLFRGSGVIRSSLYCFITLNIHILFQWLCFFFLTIPSHISGSEWVDPEDPTVIAETELLGAAASIEAAAKKLEQLKPRAKPKVSTHPFSSHSFHTTQHCIHKHLPRQHLCPPAYLCQMNST